MAQHDYIISNATFPSIRTDINSVLSAINTSNSGTSRPSSAVAGTTWLDTTSATTPTLKFFDGTDDISLATFDYSANTVNWLDSTVVFDIVGDTTPQLGGDLDVNGNSLVSTSNGNITFTPNGSGKVVISGLSFPTADGTADQVLKTDGSGNLSFTDVSGGTDWQSVVTAATLTTVAGRGYPINTTSNACTVTLPAAASVGDQVQIVDYAGTFATNNITLTSSLNIEGGTSNKILTTNREGVTITYVDATQGWVATTGVNSGDQALDAAPYSIDFLVIAGGAGGAGLYAGGGGGAGGYRTSTQSISTGNTITVTVGDGSAGVYNSPSQSTNGSNSSISGSGLTTITSAGGGGAGSNNYAGVAGGSGGGGSGFSWNSDILGGAGNTPSTSPVQGYAGGQGAANTPGSERGGGGGGGSSAVGADATTNGGSSGNGGNGGAGTASSITGSSVTRAGGGGGGTNTGGGSVGTGGAGGGGDGVISGTGNAGSVNTGSGGGGAGTAGSNVGGSGGKGVVILSMPDASYSGTTTGSPTVATGVSGKTVLTFTGSGSYTS
jgi:hypothetical protein